MVRITDNLIRNYINGDDSKIRGCTIEELENNPLFMKKVIECTQDVKMYNYCSDKVKTDFNFVLFLVANFGNNLEFLVNAVDYYFQRADDYDSKVEIALIMKNICKIHNDDREQKYDFMLNAAYIYLRMQIERIKIDEIEDKKFQHETGLGFWYIHDTYFKNEKLLTYFAKRMLKELFLDNYYGLSNILHSKYNSVAELENNGYLNCIYEAIKVYDEELYFYACTHKEVISDILNKYKSVLKTWDSYVDRNETKDYDLVHEYVYSFMSERDLIGFLSCSEQLTLVAHNLGLVDKFVKYDLIDQDDIDGYKEDKKYYNNVMKASFEDNVNFNQIKNIVTSIIFKHELPDNKEEVEKNNSKVLSLDSFRNKKLDKTK